MEIYIILGCVLAFLAIAVFAVAYICFHLTFYVRRKKGVVDDADAVNIADEILAPYRELLKEWKEQVRLMPYADAEITSFDGLKLRGKYYEYEKGAPIEIMFHGYRGSAERDMDGGIIRCFKQGRSVLVVDHRACGRSEGSVITFGVNESRDCRVWVDYVINNIDRDARIILTGISMGAATVMIASSMELPENVVAVLADCGYTDAKEIIQKTIRGMKLPPRLLYPFVRLGARIYGRFNIDETSPIEALKSARVPVLFIHGDADDFVPYDMSVRNHEVCTSQKHLVAIEGAGHAAAFLVDSEKYLATLSEFFTPLLNEKQKK